MNVFVLDVNLQTVAIIDQFESFIWTDRYNQWGDFELYTIPTVELIQTLTQDRYLWMTTSEHLMIIEEIEITTDSEEGKRLIVRGRSLESILERRIIWGQETISGNLQDEVLRIVSAQLVSPTDLLRRVPNFEVRASTNPKITTLTIDTQATCDNLYSFVQLICEIFDLGFKITMDPNDQFIFELYVGEDRTYNQFANPYVVFSPKFENLLTSRYLESKANLKTVALISGEGESWNEKLTAIADVSGGSGSGLNRREAYADGSGINRTISDEEGESIEIPEEEYVEMLKTAGLEALAEYQAVKAFEGQVDSSRTFVYGKDFFMGDIVQIENDYGRQSRSRVTELIQTQSVEEVAVYPTFSAVPNEPLAAEMIPIVAASLGSGIRALGG